MKRLGRNASQLSGGTFGLLGCICPYTNSLGEPSFIYILYRWISIRVDIITELILSSNFLFGFTIFKRLENVAVLKLLKKSTLRIELLKALQFYNNTVKLETNTFEGSGSRTRLSRSKPLLSKRL